MTPDQPATRKRLSALSALLLIAVGTAVLGLVGGLLIGTMIPGGSQPAPVQVTVLPQAGAGAQAEVVMPDVRGLASRRPARLSQTMAFPDLR